MSHWGILRGAAALSLTSWDIWIMDLSMARRRLACVAVICVAIGTPVVPAEASSRPSLLSVSADHFAAGGLAAADPAKTVRRQIKGAIRVMKLSVLISWNLLRRSLPFIGLAMLAVFIDRKLLAAWRSEGLRVFVDYVPLMVYVYTNLLFFDPAVRRSTRMLLLVAIAYGVARSDLLPDRRGVPGLIDDFLVIAIATRAFVSWCPDQAVMRQAQRALAWRRRTAALQRERNVG